jgi:hypothetical protein
MENLEFHLERIQLCFYELFQYFRQFFESRSSVKPATVQAPSKRQPLPQEVIHTQAVVSITGYKLGTAQKMLCHIRRANHKRPRSFVTVQEFADFTSIPLEDIYRHL